MHPHGLAEFQSGPVALIRARNMMRIANLGEARARNAELRGDPFERRSPDEFIEFGACEGNLRQ